MKTVTFQLKGEYIDQIKAGTKRKEYRDLRKYNTTRLCYLSSVEEMEDDEEVFVEHGKEIWRTRKDITHIQFFNGYRKDRKELICEVKGIEVQDNPERDAPGEYLFVISLGRIVKTKNF